MQVLVFNAGSSSLKCSVFDTACSNASEAQRFKLNLERLEQVDAGMAQLPGLLRAQGLNKFDAIGHRVVHGGSRFRQATLIDDNVLAAIVACTDLAPLHNPPALAGIRIAAQLWPGLPQVAVFDTAFHHRMPPRATEYAVPQAWRDTGLRRYGFHGTSHKYVMEHSAAALHSDARSLRIISCHLGNGASVCAIEHGVSVDTSMGMTALEGLVMGTRSGDVDPGLFVHVQRQLGLSLAQIEDMLYQHSGLAALSGAGNDMRDIEQRAAAGDLRAQLAIQVYAYRVRKYIGAYAAAMGGVDVITFTGGIGENSSSMRKRICERLDFLGLAFDDDANAGVRLVGDEVATLHEPHSRVQVLVTATREQWMIARETARLLDALQRPGAAPPPVPAAAAESAANAMLTSVPVPVSVPTPTSTPIPIPIPIAVSARHVHLTEAACAVLFGGPLHAANALSQPGQWAAQETVDAIGPRGELHHLRVLGPCRAANQIEISATDAFVLGVDAPLRLSGQTQKTPVVTLRGPAGSLRSDGVIVAQRHIHATPADAVALGVVDGQTVDVEVQGQGRSLVYRDVAVRVSADCHTEMHIDTDEANAAHIDHVGSGVMVRAGTALARIQPAGPP